MEKLLYYPNISLPKTPWLFHSLLYWKEIKTITPTIYFDQPDTLYKNYMRELIETGLVTQIHPGEHIDNMSDFRKNFLNYIDNFYMPKIDSYKTYPDGTLKYSHKIHHEKLNLIGQDFIDRDLAFIKNGWYYTHGSIAKDFMFYLANVLGPVVNSQPITDNPWHMKTRFNSTSITDSSKTIYKEKLRRIILNGAFPSPANLINISELYDFKEKYGDKLHNFRNFIEIKIIEIDNAQDHNREAMVNNLLKEINESKEEIKEAMKSKWKVPNIENSLLTLSLGGSLYDQINQSEGSILVGSTILGLTGAVIGTIRNHKAYKQKKLENPLSYAYLVGTKLK
ncbi:DUF6236 family protein [Halobacillus sp. A1]|uniref:DUF6236 family protein n=1 Tax=Halobacillus sp. A1 TaxID=2880262 RepID=UPI0020A68F33|nr:DUF6236 family protein [Halobacillus sp. A1]MCP3032628.1 DUF6236 family protein [Halobacillus sp. A1]